VPALASVYIYAYTVGVAFPWDTIAFRVRAAVVALVGVIGCGRVGFESVVATGDADLGEPAMGARLTRRNRSRRSA
jgi:hypothetical protein